MGGGLLGRFAPDSPDARDAAQCLTWSNQQQILLLDGQLGRRRERQAIAETLDFRDVDWVAEQLNIDKNAVYRYLNEGVLPGLQLGRKWLISESSLVAAL